MISILVLAGEFLQHAVIIVLVGVMLVEYFNHGRGSSNAAIKRELVCLLSATVLVAVLATSSYFANPDSVLYCWLVNVPVTILAPILVWYGIRNVLTPSVRAAFYLFVLIEAVTLVQCVFHSALGAHMAGMEMVQPFLDTAEVLLLYFFAIGHCILSEKR